MPRILCLAVVAVLAFAVAPSAASAATGGSSAGARECVASTAPGKDRGNCVMEVARDLAQPMTLTAAYSGVSYSGNTTCTPGPGSGCVAQLWTLAGTGFAPSSTYDVAVYDVATNRILTTSWGAANVATVYTDASGVINTLLMLNPCESGREVEIRLGPSYFWYYNSQPIASTRVFCM